MVDAVLAKTELPLIGQLSLLRSGMDDHVATLASSPHLHPEAALSLLKAAESDSIMISPSTSWKAIKAISDQDRLADYISKGSFARAAAAAQNPNAPQASLVEALASSDPNVVMSALINPSTPERERREFVDPSFLNSVAIVGSSLAHSVIRAAELVLNNPWLSEIPQDLDNVFHRAMACSPDSSVETVLSLKKFSRSGGKFVRSHPLVLDKNKSWDDYTLDDLCNHTHPTSDLVALSRPACTEKHAARMLSRKAPKEIEPQVLARILRRFGLAPLTLLTSPPKFAGSRTSGAAFAHSSAEWLDYWNDDSSQKFVAATGLIDTLGSDVDAWEMCMALLPKWRLGYDQLASTAIKLGTSR